MPIAARTLVIAPMQLGAELQTPSQVRGLIIFAHGSGSSRFSPRNRMVAEGLARAGFATLLLDLLTPEEAGDRANVFNIDLLSERVLQAIDWSGQEPPLQAEPIGLFGASTGAAAALKAAAARPDRVQAVVSRGGRPDLAGQALAEVRAATLLIVGSRDDAVLDLNREAMRRMPGLVRLEIVPGATHLFEEPGALEQVVEHARRWFAHHLAAASAHL